MQVEFWIFWVCLITVSHPEATAHCYGCPHPYGWVNCHALTGNPVLRYTRRVWGKQMYTSSFMPSVYELIPLAWVNYSGSRTWPDSELWKTNGMWITEITAYHWSTLSGLFKCITFHWDNDYVHQFMFSYALQGRSSWCMFQWCLLKKGCIWHQH